MIEVQISSLTIKSAELYVEMAFKGGVGIAYSKGDV